LELTNTDVGPVIDALVRVHADGRLNDLMLAVKAETEGMDGDLDIWPEHQAAVEQIAAAASEILMLPLAECRAAVAEKLLPATRRDVALMTIRQFDPRFGSIN
jgi:hypothetical protein